MMSTRAFAPVPASGMSMASISAGTPLIVSTIASAPERPGSILEIVAELQMIQNAAVLRIKESDRSIAIR